MKKQFTQLCFAAVIVFFSLLASSKGLGVIVPMDSTQAEFTVAIKNIMNYSSSDYRYGDSHLDSLLFPKYGDETLYWILTGENRGSILVPERFNYGTRAEYTSFDWQNHDLLALQMKFNSRLFTILRTSIEHNENTASWESLYFKNMFDSYLYDWIYYTADDKELDTTGIDWGTRVLIIPSFTQNNGDDKFYIDSIFNRSPLLRAKILQFLARSGSIYAEGNAVYFIEKLGLLSAGAVDFANALQPDFSTNMINLSVPETNNPICFSRYATGERLYSDAVPMVSLPTGAEVVASANQRPVVFVLKGTQANGGRVICNLGLPTIGGMNSIKNGSRQLMWTLNSLLYPFAKTVDVTRSVFNEIADSIPAGPNAVSFNTVDTFEVRVKVRNVSSEAVSGIKVVENIRFYKFVDVVSSPVTPVASGSTITFDGISMPAHSETVIVYRLRTPDLTDTIRNIVDKYISSATYVYPTRSDVTYSDASGYNYYNKYYCYTSLMFGAEITADADLNWKNFLGLYYQPFKIFMIMENKQRTSAESTVYAQYVPKDVPFYAVDHNLNIPILKTPGGKFIDVMRGSNSESNIEFDMNSSGKPDAWLDTASIYPKGYRLEDDEVFWLNPWEHLRSGDTTYYEDINHDGLRPMDTNGDGIVDVETPGDKIRVWRITWQIDKVAGYAFYDPYCSYELWVDPPDLVKMAAGVGQAYGRMSVTLPGAYYPNSPTVAGADLTDTSWAHWMKRDETGNVVWAQLIFQRINNYEGYTFIDTLATGYRLLPTDVCYGTVPVPNNEYIAVLSLGGEEIDMNKFTPNKSLYSKIDYKTIFNEDKTTPIRSTYTYYAPLPNPMQFEYLTNNFTILDSAGVDTLDYLPAKGKAQLQFDMDASTEYSYYWIRNAGHDVDFRDPSEAAEGTESLGDGVFGYMVYDIPRGMGGYKISLPKNADGTYDIDRIVQIDGASYARWLDNPKTKNNIEIVEQPFVYRVLIPQILIPPALDDDNNDGIDDWRDDRGDRFCSATGFLHDAFMVGNGEQYRDYPAVPFRDDIYGMVDSGWYAGADNTYGDDRVEKLGKTHVRIRANYEGTGREGSVEISKGGWLVVEEIFGGSPWVIFSHVLNGFARGTDIKIASKAVPSLLKYGTDTVYIKHTITDASEPHSFNADFDPYLASFGRPTATATTYVGGKDPCSLILPAVNMPSIIDPKREVNTLTLVPLADGTNPDLVGYPKTVRGAFAEVRIEVQNGTEFNWTNTSIVPDIPTLLGSTHVEMAYACYPRPLVPAQVDPATGRVITGGDDIGTFRAGWRFNQPEGEVLVKMGQTLPLIQDARKAYFIFLIEIDTNLPNGVYSIPFRITGDMRNYSGRITGSVSAKIPDAMFSITSKNSSLVPNEYQKLVIGEANLGKIETKFKQNVIGLQNVRGTTLDLPYTSFDTLALTFPALFVDSSHTETIDMTSINKFPTKDCSTLLVYEKALVSSFGMPEDIDITTSQKITYNEPDYGNNYSTSPKTTASTAGPRLTDYRRVWAIDGQRVSGDSIAVWDPNSPKRITMIFEVANSGADMADSIYLQANLGPYFAPIPESLPAGAVAGNGVISVPMPMSVPGDRFSFFIDFTETQSACNCIYDTNLIVNSTELNFRGKSLVTPGATATYLIHNPKQVDLLSNDLRLEKLACSAKSLDNGQTARLSAKIRNAATGIDSVLVCFYGVINRKDTVLLHAGYAKSINPSETVDYGFDWTVPDSIVYLDFFARINGDGRISEFCRNNNTAVLSLPFIGPNWIVKVTTNPNPASYQADISYTLPREMRSIGLIIYSMDGEEVYRVNKCATSTGMHEIHWLMPNLPKGAYLMKFFGVDEKGNATEYFDKMMKSE